MFASLIAYLLLSCYGVAGRSCTALGARTAGYIEDQGCTPNVCPRNATAHRALSDDHRILRIEGNLCHSASWHSRFPDRRPNGYGGACAGEQDPWSVAQTRSTAAHHCRSLHG